MRRKLVDILRSGAKELELIEKDKDWALECALRLEDKMFKLFKAGKPYADKSRSLLFNLGDSKNPKGRELLLR